MHQFDKANSRNEGEAYGNEIDGYETIQYSTGIDNGINYRQQRQQQQMHSAPNSVVHRGRTIYGASRTLIDFVAPEAPKCGNNGNGNGNDMLAYFTPADSEASFRAAAEMKRLQEQQAKEQQHFFAGEEFGGQKQNLVVGRNQGADGIFLDFDETIYNGHMAELYNIGDHMTNNDTAFAMLTDGPFLDDANIDFHGNQHQEDLDWPGAATPVYQPQLELLMGGAGKGDMAQFVSLEPLIVPMDEDGDIHGQQMESGAGWVVASGGIPSQNGSSRM